MSNGTRFAYTVEQKSVLLDQFSKAMELVRERNRRPEQVTQALQVIIGDEDIVTSPKVVKSPTGHVFHVISDPKIRSAADVINALDCPIKLGLAKNPGDIPMVVQPVDCKVRPVPVGNMETADELFGLFPKIATPAEFFAFHARFPKERWKQPHITVWWDARGRLCSALVGTHELEEFVCIPEDSATVILRKDYHLLVRE